MQIRLLASSDVHGFVFPYQYSDLKLCNQGFLKLNATMNEYVKENTLKIDNGDLLEGSPFLTYYYKNKSGKHPMVDAINLGKFDYVNVGNHDFNYGTENLKEYLSQISATCLLGNIKYQGDYIGKPYHIHKFDEKHSIALIGACTHFITYWEKACNLEGLEITPAFDYVKETVEYIKKHEKVNGICVVYHGGIERDPITGQPTEQLTGENEGYRMCEEIDGIDVLISGHQHRSIACKIKNTHVTQTAYKGSEFALIDWDLDTKEINEKLIPASIDYSQNDEASFRALEDKVQIWLDEKVGEVDNYSLEIIDPFDARLHKHPLISFMNEVSIDATGAMLSGEALFNEAVGFKKNITMRDIVSTYVYPNTTFVLEVSGKILKEYLEKNAEYFAVIDGKVAVSPEYISPKPQHYNYDMVDGLDYVIKVSNPKGSRIISMKYQDSGQEIKEDDILTLAINNYRAGGGGDFLMFKQAKVLKEIQTDMVTLISEYLLSHPHLNVKHRDNIKVII